MHVAAAYDSLDCMVIISNFGGFELFLERNQYGKRPIDVAEKMKNFECYEALQKLERNLQFQNAVLEREITSLEKATKKKSKVGKNRVAPIKSHRLSSNRGGTDLILRQTP